MGNATQRPRSASVPERPHAHRAANHKTADDSAVLRGSGGADGNVSSRYHTLREPQRYASLVDVPVPTPRPCVELDRADWVPDARRPRCSSVSCSSEFTFFVRRHHCRVCGEVFCAACTSKRVPSVGTAAQILRQQQQSRGRRPRAPLRPPPSGHLTPGVGAESVPDALLSPLSLRRKEFSADTPEGAVLQRLELPLVRVCDVCYVTHLDFSTAFQPHAAAKKGGN